MNSLELFFMIGAQQCLYWGLTYKDKAVGRGLLSLAATFFVLLRDHAN